MGTRADFYIFHSADNLEWLGSIGWDGDEVDAVASPVSEQDFRDKLKVFFSTRDDVTIPSEGWPWPWRDSRTTYLAYVYIDGIGVVHRDFYDYYESARDRGNYVPDDGIVESYVLTSTEEILDSSKVPLYKYPDMKDKQNVKRNSNASGLLFLST